MLRAILSRRSASALIAASSSASCCMVLKRPYHFLMSLKIGFVGSLNNSENPVPHLFNEWKFVNVPSVHQRARYCRLAANIRNSCASCVMAS